LGEVVVVVLVLEVVEAFLLGEGVVEAFLLGEVVVEAFLLGEVVVVAIPWVVGAVVDFRHRVQLLKKEKEHI